MILHIGYPKCASTSLQSLFACSNGRFLGCNPKAAPGAFYDPAIGYGLEGLFRFGPDDLYTAWADEARAAIAKIDDAHDGLAILSYENISFRLTPWDLPTDIKIKRLPRLISHTPKIALVYRDVPDFLISLYKNHLTFGYTGGFDTFLQDALVMADYGWLRDLDLGLLAARLEDAFAGAEIVLADLETADMIPRLFATLGLEAPDEHDLRLNISLSDAQTDALRAHNAALPHRKQMLDWLELHRIFPEDVIPEDERFRMSRARLAQNEALRVTAQTDVFDRTAIVWPEVVLDLQARNEAFVSKARDARHITLI